MAYPVHRRHRHYHFKVAIKAAIRSQDSWDMWSADDMDSPSPSPTPTSSTPSPHLTTPNYLPSPPQNPSQPTTIMVDHAPAPTMPPAAPHNIFALPSTSPAQRSPLTILAILLLIIILTLAATWTLLVCLIHYRGTTTGGKAAHAARTRLQSPIAAQAASPLRRLLPRSPSTPPSTHNRAWPCNPFQRARKPKHKYEALEHRDADAEDDNDGARALSSGIELRSIEGSGGQDGSPLNPFLVEPGRDSDDELGQGRMRRGETEWVLRHRAFFGAEGDENSPASSLGMGEGRDRDDVQDGEALLAGAAGSLVFERGDPAWRRGWVDWGLAAVDGTVDRLTTKIVRWTDEGELVLPVAEG